MRFYSESADYIQWISPNGNRYTYDKFPIMEIVKETKQEVFDDFEKELLGEFYIKWMTTAMIYRKTYDEIKKKHLHPITRFRH